jgi:hypothetical protein
VAAALEKISSTATAPTIRRAAELARQQSRAGFGFITQWRTAGPFRQDGRDYADLFDFLFRPETAESEGVKWAPLPVATGAKRTWLVNLRPAMGKQEAVAYAQTWLHCDAAQPVQMEIGSDSSVKVWLNQKLVHTNPALRVLRPGADTLSATLQPGWNSLLVKLAQPGQSGAFCVRLLEPDRTPVKGLRIDPAGPRRN